jgi:hypothetical protein
VRPATAAGIGYLLRPVDAAAGEEIIRVEIEPGGDCQVRSL